MIDTELLAANSILRRGVRYKLPAPLLFRLVGIKHTGIVIKQLNLGTELRVARLMLKAGITEKLHEEMGAIEFMVKYYAVTLRIVALSTLNTKSLIPGALWFRKAALRRITAWQLFELYTTVLQYSGTRPFMSITGLAIKTRVTMPNTGRMTKRS